jgi:hypothetical protein
MEISEQKKDIEMDEGGGRGGEKLSRSFSSDEAGHVLAG